jgi:signal transduction histidine kinase
MDVLVRLCSGSAFHTSNGYVRATYDYHMGSLLISVKDTSEGIPEERLRHVFERFVNPSESKQYGTVLTLPICKMMIEQMGGTMDVMSKVGEGTTVWITIPCEVTDFEQAINPLAPHEKETERMTY